MANEIKIQSKSKKTKLIIIIVAILIALATIVAVIFVPKNAKARKVEEQLSLGTKYLTELDYEQAIVAYEAAIKIDPKCTDAYLGLADVYEEMGEFDKAAEVLAEAKQVIEDADEVARIEKKQKKVEEKEQEATKPTATPVPAPTATPEPTVAPTATPLPTPTPAPTEAPVVTTAPVATEAPKPTATPKPTEAPKPTDVPKPTATPVPTTAPESPYKEIGKASVGEYVTFGTYEQDNHLDNGTEPIEWVVLDKKDGNLLLLSKYVLDCKQYNEEDVDVTWETCTLRNWLNEEFYKTVFSAKEQARISEVNLKNPDNAEHYTPGGNDTTDKVFYLSVDEMNYYFPPGDYNPMRIGKRTEYSMTGGCDFEWEAQYYGNSVWGLRSPGSYRYYTASVNSYGYVEMGGDSVTFPYGMRPAIWVKIEENGANRVLSMPAPRPEKEVLHDLGKATVGDYVAFGVYEQDNDLINGAEEIQWRVLDKKDGKLLLLSNYALAGKQYHEENGSVTWEESTLRKWLNETFLKEAFGSAEQAKIAESRLKNGENPWVNTGSGNDTYDRVFLLSAEEAITYFDSNPSAGDPLRLVYVTEYAKGQGAGHNMYTGRGQWWLRTQGDGERLVTSVDIQGRVERWGTLADDTFLVVRPAIWVEP